MAVFAPFSPPRFLPFPYDENGNFVPPTPGNVATAVNQFIDNAQSNVTAVANALPGQNSQTTVTNPNTNQSTTLTGVVSQGDFNNVVNRLIQVNQNQDAAIAALQVQGATTMSPGNYGYGGMQQVGCNSSGILPGAAQPVFVVNQGGSGGGGLGGGGGIDPLMMVLLLQGGLGGSGTTGINPLLLILLMGNGGMGSNPLIWLLLLNNQAVAT